MVAAEVVNRKVHRHRPLVHLQRVAVTDRAALEPAQHLRTVSQALRIGRARCVQVGRPGHHLPRRLGVLWRAVLFFWDVDRHRLAGFVDDMEHEFLPIWNMRHTALMATEKNARKRGCLSAKSLKLPI